MKPDKKIVLKPCPFCGGEAVHDNDVGNNDDYYVEFIICNSCGISTPRKRWKYEELVVFLE